MEVVTQEFLDDLTKQAITSPRKRMFFSLHKSTDPVLKLLNAIEPESYIPPHKHVQENKQELFVALRGKLLVLFFDDTQQITKQYIIGPHEKAAMVEIPVNTWHTVWSLESGSLILEVIKGPFDAGTHKELASWAPSENDPKATQFMQTILRNLSL